MLQHPTGHAGIFVRHEQSVPFHIPPCVTSPLPTAAKACQRLLTERFLPLGVLVLPFVEPQPWQPQGSEPPSKLRAACGQSTQWGAGGHFAPIRGQVSEVAELSYSQAMTRQFSLCLDEPVGYVCWRTIICPCWQVPSSHFSSSIYVLQCTERENELKPIKKTLRKEIL